MSKRIRKKKARAEIIKLVEGSRHLDGILFVDSHAIKFECASVSYDICPSEERSMNIQCKADKWVKLNHFKLDENGRR